MRNIKLLSGIAILSIILITAIIGPPIAGSLPIYDGKEPNRVGAYPSMMENSEKNPLGTDPLGRDVLIIMLNGIRLSLTIGIIAGVFATFLGVIVGFIAGFIGNRTDDILRIVIDMFLVFPTLPLMLILSIYIPKWSLLTMGLLLGAFGWPFVARTTRAQILSLRERPYVDLARLNNQGTLEIIFQELLPSLLPYIFLSMAASTIGAMLAEAGLQFIGIGAGLPPTLGYMLGRGYATGALSMKLYAQMMGPAAIMVGMFLALNLINMGLEESFNPRLRAFAEER